MQLMRLADVPLDRRDRVFQLLQAPRRDRRVTLAEFAIWCVRLCLAQKPWPMPTIRSRYRHLFIDLCSKLVIGAFSLIQLARCA